MTSRANFSILSRSGKHGKSRVIPISAILAYDTGIPLTQISVLLGHASTKTTEKYLDLSLDLETTASDFIPLAGHLTGQ